MGVSIKTIAKKCDVSIATVSRVINSSGRVSDKNYQLVKNAIAELNYMPNKIARNLRMEHANAVGLIVPDIANDFFSTLALHIENELQAHDYVLYLCNTQEDIEKEKFYLNSLLENKVSAIIITSADLDLLHESIKNIQIPLILLDRYKDTLDNDKLVSIKSNNAEGAYTAGKELISKGANKILYLRDEKVIEPESQRELGIKKAISSNNDIEFQIHKTKSRPENARLMIKEIYKSFKFNGVFCSNDIIALGALKGLSDMQIKIPDTVQVIGFDGLELGAYFSPALSTIKQDVDLMGKKTAEYVINLIKEKEIKNRHLVLSTKYIKRETTF